MRVLVSQRFILGNCYFFKFGDLSTVSTADGEALQEVSSEEDCEADISNADIQFSDELSDGDASVMAFDGQLSDQGEHIKLESTTVILFVLFLCTIVLNVLFMHYFKGYLSCFIQQNFRF